MPNNEGIFIRRPESVWDTRAPFKRFINSHRKENENYWVLLLLINSKIRDLESLDKKLNAKSIFALHNKDIIWGSYRKSFGREADGTFPNPDIEGILNSATRSIHYLTEHAIISYLGEFETFMQCWALNYLLAKLESDPPIELTSKERELVKFFNEQPHRATFVNIHTRIPEIERQLRQTPHLFKQVGTLVRAKAPTSNVLNAFTVIDFWREWRNLLVHTSGKVTARFFNRYSNFWKEWVKSHPSFPHIPAFKLGEQLRLNHYVFRAITTSHYVAAEAIKHEIIKISNARRGHIFAPGPLPTNQNIQTKDLPSLPKMLLEGDHLLSLSYANNGSYHK